MGDFRRFLVEELSGEEAIKRINEYLDDAEYEIEKLERVLMKGDTVIELVNTYWKRSFIKRCMFYDNSYKNNELIPNFMIVKARSSLSASLIEVTHVQIEEILPVEAFHECCMKRGLRFKLMDRKKDKDKFYKGIYAEITI